MSLGHSYIKATDGKVYRCPVIKSDLGELYFDDGEPEVLFRVQWKSLHGLKKDQRRAKLREIAEAFFASIGNIVTFRYADARIQEASDSRFGFTDVLMTKRVSPGLISEHEGIFDNWRSAGEGTYANHNGP